MNLPYVRRSACAAWLLASGLALTPPAQAVPVQFGSSFYDFVAFQDIAWEDAKNAAASSTVMDVNGHLATITSQAENHFLSTNFATFTGFAGAWIGALVDAAGTGRWVVGPESGDVFSQGGAAVGGAFESWGGIEPNNAPSAGYMNLGNSGPGISTGQWADSGGGVSRPADPIKGYLVEFDVPVGVPEPSTVVLLGLGLLALAARRRVAALRPRRDLARRPTNRDQTGGTSCRAS